MFEEKRVCDEGLPNDNTTKDYALKKNLSENDADLSQLSDKMKPANFKKYKDNNTRTCLVLLNLEFQQVQS